MHLRTAIEAERLGDEPEHHDHPERHGEHRPARAKAVEVDAAIGTLVAVATRKIRRTERLLPETAFVDQVSSCHGSHSNANSSATLPAPAPSRARDKEPDELREGEDVRQVEEELDRIRAEVLGALRYRDALHGAIVRLDRSRSCSLAACR